MARVDATEDSAPRKGSSERSSPWVNDRSQSPRLRSRPTSLSPLLGDPSGARESHSPALIFALTYCVGYTVVIQTRTGESYKGILHTTGLLNGESHFVLRKAKKIRTDESEDECWIERLVIPSEDCLQLLAKDLPSSQDPMPPRPLSSPGLPFPNSSEIDHHHHQQLSIRFGDFEEAGFMGDKNRERLGAGLYGRALQRWVPEGEVGGSLSDFDDSKHEVGDWDQFEENEKLFGLKTDFNMDLYTTPLRANESKYSVAEADEIAREIRNASSTNLHLQEERGQLAFDDSGLNEEMLYSSVLPEASSPSNHHHHRHQNEEGRKRDELMQTPPSTPPATSTPKALLHRSKFQPNQLIFSQNSRPMIIKGRPIPHDARKEVNKIVREISNSRAPPRGSPLRNSPLIGDPEAVQALNLQMTSDMKSSQRPYIQQFENFKKFGAKVNLENAREAQMNQFKEFSKTMEFKLSSRKALSEVRSSSETTGKPVVELESHERDNQGKEDFTSLPNPPKESALGAQLAATAAANPPPVIEEIDLNPEGWTQKALPKLNIERRVEDDDDDDDDGNLSSDQPNSGRGLNPHATPFNPGHGAETQFESTLLMMEDAGNGGQGGGGETTTEHSPHDSPIISSPISPKFERAMTPEGGRLTNASLPTTPVEKDYPPPPPPPVLVVQDPRGPPPPNGGMTPSRIRQPPPPPPPPVPRLRTPPPPPPLPQGPEMTPGPPPPPILPQGPGSYQGGGPPRPSRQIQSPGPRRPTHQGPMMEPRPPNMIMMPSSRPPPPNQAPAGQQGAGGVPPHVSNATHVPMHVMHQHLGPPPPPPPPYGYPPTDINGQIPVMYQYPPPHMAPGPPPNGSGNPQTVPQPMMYPAFYPHPAMPPYGMPYGPPMMPQGPMPGQYVPMVQAPVAQPRPRPDGGGRSRKPGRRAESFFSGAPKRG